MMSKIEGFWHFENRWRRGGGGSTEKPFTS
jgi:hypothetical protein